MNRFAVGSEQVSHLRRDGSTGGNRRRGLGFLSQCDGPESDGRGHYHGHDLFSYDGDECILCRVYPFLLWRLINHYRYISQTQCHKAIFLTSNEMHQSLKSIWLLKSNSARWNMERARCRSLWIDISCTRWRGRFHHFDIITMIFKLTSGRSENQKMSREIFHHFLSQKSAFGPCFRTGLTDHFSKMFYWYRIENETLQNEDFGY